MFELLKILDFLRTNLLRIGLFLLTIWYWNYFLGWKLTAVLLSMICIHEYGHLWQMKKFGISTRGIYLTPFGGIAIGESVGKTYWQEVVISLMGPVWGLCYALMFVLLFLVSGEKFFGGCAFLIGFIHLFNFLPINPLDGGRVAKAIAISIHPLLAIILLWSNIVFCVWVFIKSFSFLFALIAMLGYAELKTITQAERYKKNPDEFNKNSEEFRKTLVQQIHMLRLSRRQKWLAFFCYIALALIALALVVGFVLVAFEHPDFMRFLNH